MTDAWGGAWGDAWGGAWGADDAPAAVTRRQVVRLQSWIVLSLVLASPIE